MRYSRQKVLNECMINNHELIYEYRMADEISHGKSLLTNSLLKDFMKYLMKLKSKRYQTSSTFTESKRNKEKSENEVNDKYISHQKLDNEIFLSFSSKILPLFDYLNHF